MNQPIIEAVSIDTPSLSTCEPLDTLFDTDAAVGQSVTLDEQIARSGNVACAKCGTLFWPRNGTGGKPQKFCSVDCRRAADAERKANAPTREPQRAQNAELSKLERAEQIEEWRELVAQLGPPSNQPAEKGIRKTAEELGVSTREVHRAEEIAQITDDAKDAAVEAREPWQGRIDRQYAIEVVGVDNCSSIDVHLTQEGQHGHGDEDATIIVTAANAVKLARMILWAAGFRAVGFYALTRHGNQDIEDGAEADQFEWRG